MDSTNEQYKLTASWALMRTIVGVSAIGTVIGLEVDRLVTMAVKAILKPINMSKEDES